MQKQASILIGHKLPTLSFDLSEGKSVAGAALKKDAKYSFYFTQAPSSHYVVDCTTGTQLKRAKGKGRKTEGTVTPKGKVVKDGNRYCYTLKVTDDTGEQVFNFVFVFASSELRLDLPCVCYTRLDRYEEHLSSLLFTALCPNAKKEVLWEDVESLLYQFNKLHIFNVSKDMKDLLENLPFVRDRVDLAILQTHAEVSGLYVNEAGWRKMFHYAYAVFDTLCKDKELCTLWTEENKILQGLFHHRYLHNIPPQSYVVRFVLEGKASLALVLTLNDGESLRDRFLIRSLKGNCKTDWQYHVKPAENEEKTNLYLTFRAILSDLRDLQLCNLCLAGDSHAMSAVPIPPPIWTRRFPFKLQQPKQPQQPQLLPPPPYYGSIAPYSLPLPEELDQDSDEQIQAELESLIEAYLCQDDTAEDMEHPWGSSDQGVVSLLSETFNGF